MQNFGKIRWAFFLVRACLTIGGCLRVAGSWQHFTFHLMSKKKIIIKRKASTPCLLFSLMLLVGKSCTLGPRISQMAGLMLFKALSEFVRSCSEDKARGNPSVPRTRLNAHGWGAYPVFLPHPSPTPVPKASCVVLCQQTLW